jgi:hypothetical protein
MWSSRSWIATVPAATDATTSMLVANAQVGNRCEALDMLSHSAAVHVVSDQSRRTALRV